MTWVVILGVLRGGIALVEKGNSRNNTSRRETSWLFHCCV